LHVVGRYGVDGKILFIPVKGAGRFSGNFTGGTGDIKIKGIHKQINGETHFVVNKMDIKITVKSGQIELGEIFGKGDKVLGDIISATINQNFEVFSKDLIPLIEKSLSKIFKRTANKILERFTMAQLFP
jgi:Haemolymph juvenile hormone binding protein (JHBP)